MGHRRYRRGIRPVTVSVFLSLLLLTSVTLIVGSGPASGHSSHAGVASVLTPDVSVAQTATTFGPIAFEAPASTGIMPPTVGSYVAGTSPLGGQDIANSSRDGCGPPAIALDLPTVNGSTVVINGGTEPGGSSCSIVGVNWVWGDGSTSESWFAASHSYLMPGTYQITATSHQSDGKTASAAASATALMFPTWPVIFNESGLPSGAYWSVTIAGQTNSSTGSAIGFIAPTGSFAFSVETAAPEYVPDSSSGTFEVAGHPASVPVAFESLAEENLNV